MYRENEERVIVVGGGPVGLVTALSLAKKGVPVTVLEADTTPIQTLEERLFILQRWKCFISLAS